MWREHSWCDWLTSSHEVVVTIEGLTDEDNGELWRSHLGWMCLTLRKRSKAWKALTPDGVQFLNCGNLCCALMTAHTCTRHSAQTSSAHGRHTTHLILAIDLSVTLLWTQTHQKEVKDVRLIPGTLTSSSGCENPYLAWYFTVFYCQKCVAIKVWPPGAGEIA